MTNRLSGWLKSSEARCPFIIRADRGLIKGYAFTMWRTCDWVAHEGAQQDVNASAFRHLYGYHFAENRKLWDCYVTQLSPEQFTQHLDYSHGSVRDQIVHLMTVDDVWFSELRGVEPSEPLPPADFDDRERIRAHWDHIEQRMRDDLAALRDDMLFSKPIKEPDVDRDLIVWQVLLHVVNHGTDHRAQILRLLHDLGVRTASQDYIFYVYDNPAPVS